MNTVRKFLGSHKGLRATQLTERETVVLIVCAGRSAGYTVRTEIPVKTTGCTNLPVRGKIDVGWFHPITNELVVAWEVDGQDAPNSHFSGNQKKGTAGNLAKLKDCGASERVQVLYSVKNDLTIKRPSRKEFIEAILPEDIVTIATDEELMMPGGIEKWINTHPLIEVQ